MNLPIITSAVALCATVTGGLLSGLYFAFEVSTRKSFARLPDDQYVEVFAGINQAILNPRFLTVFALAPLSSVLLAILVPTRWTILAATASLVALSITVAGNVPLNNYLDNAFTSQNAVSEIRANFESRWNSLNAARCVAQTVAVGATLLFALNTKG